MKGYYKTDNGILYNGDCLDVMGELIKQGIKFDAIITDPPYGTTACKWDNVIDFDEMWERLKLLRNNNTPIVLFGSEPFSSRLRVSNLKEFRYDWIWDKGNSANYAVAKYQPLKIHEIVSVFSEKTHNYYPLGLIKFGKIGRRGSTAKTLGSTLKTENFQEYTNYPKTIIKNKLNMSGQHPTQKPLELIEYLIETYTKVGDTVLDFTSGSGTTALACERLNRRWVCIELKQKYCDVTVKRLSAIQQKLF